MEYTSQELKMMAEMMRIYDKLKDTKEFNNAFEDGDVGIKEMIEPINREVYKHKNARWRLCI
ncbi:hypothetical protein CON64_22740 [Bacillus pseudomycoides]|nr:hypothetical protein CON64_22740 [Bacillus pseudomycoides]